MSNKTSDNNKRIAKNTLLLYIRMIFTMGVTLYTSRVILNTLGVEDYGIYNVAGGVISMFSFINVAIGTGTLRYITYQLGKNDLDKLQTVFSTCIQIHVLISFVTILLGETIGLWFLYEKLVIPEERFEAALWVYQCSILATVVNIMSTPYNADIIAHEKMSAFAYISVLEVSLKLLIVYILVIASFDKLKLYAILLLSVQLLIRYIYGRYCAKHFVESKYKHIRDKKLFREMMSFSGWNFFGAISGVVYTQGLNMLLNMFFGPIVNAARGIAVQVQGAIQQFVANFQTALNPQITKTYANGDFTAMHNLMFRSAKFSYYLLFLLTLPVILETNFILKLWLGIVPENTVIFLRIILCTSLIYSIANPMITANQATGIVKTYQLVIGLLLMFILPISYICLRLGFPAYVVFLVHLVMELCCQIARMLLLRKTIFLSIKDYIYNIYIPIATVTIISIIVPLLVYFYMPDGFGKFLTICISCAFSIVLTTYFCGLSKHEKEVILKKIILKIKK